MPSSAGSIRPRTVCTLPVRSMASPPPDSGLGHAQDAAAGVGEVAAHRRLEALDVGAPGKAERQAIRQDATGILLDDPLDLLVGGLTLGEVPLALRPLHQLADVRIGV